MNAFDTAERDLLGRAALRTVTVASPLQGDAFVQPMDASGRGAADMSAHVGLISEAFRRIGQNPPSDPYEFDRLQALWTSYCGRSTARSSMIVRDIDAVLAPARQAPPDGRRGGQGG